MSMIVWMMPHDSQIWERTSRDKGWTRRKDWNWRIWRGIRWWSGYGKLLWDAYAVTMKYVAVIQQPSSLFPYNRTSHNVAYHGWGLFKYWVEIFALQILTQDSHQIMVMPPNVQLESASRILDTHIPVNLGHHLVLRSHKHRSYTRPQPQYCVFPSQNWWTPRACFSIQHY